MNSIAQRSEWIQSVVVTAAQMRTIENRIFAAGMPIPALMEKVGLILTQKIIDLYKLSDYPKIGVLVGPGHNGGDALVIARELHHRGYSVCIYQPFPKCKELTAQHVAYTKNLGILFSTSWTDLQNCNLIIDGIFGFGLERSLTGEIAQAIDDINTWSIPIVSIDVPSGLHTDTGEALGTALRANHTFCLGLWKQGLLQDCALPYAGQVDLIDFDIPRADAVAVLGEEPSVRRITNAIALANLPLPRPLVTHKYKMGHLLLICGSKKYSGGAILATLGAQASGVGMLSVAVPQSLQPILTSHSPESLIIGCPETDEGAIAQLPDSIDLENYDVIACGPGITPVAVAVVTKVLAANVPLVLDADGLNIVAAQGWLSQLAQRQAPTILTPHAGEFKRLFPDLAQQIDNRIETSCIAAQQAQTIVVLKGAITAIASPTGKVWVNPYSTPALARGGSGDVLTGLLGGLLAQGIMRGTAIKALVNTAVWWHAQAGIYAAQNRTELGVDAYTLAQTLLPCLQSIRH